MDSVQNPDNDACHLLILLQWTLKKSLWADLLWKIMAGFCHGGLEELKHHKSFKDTNKIFSWKIEKIKKMSLRRTAAEK